MIFFSLEWWNFYLPDDRTGKTLCQSLALRQRSSRNTLLIPIWEAFVRAKKRINKESLM
jgi:hypothetical protein